MVTTQVCFTLAIDSLLAAYLPHGTKTATLDDIRRAYHEGEEATIALFMQVIAQVSQLAALVEQQAEAIRALEAKLGKDSHTSSKPLPATATAKPL